MGMPQDKSVHLPPASSLYRMRGKNTIACQFLAGEEGCLPNINNREPNNNNTW